MRSTIQSLKLLRGLGLSQSEIARRTGIAQPKLSRWESGEIPDAADDALKLLRLADELAPPQVATQSDAPNGHIDRRNPNEKYTGASHLLRRATDKPNNGRED